MAKSTRHTFKKLGRLITTILVSISGAQVITLIVFGLNKMVRRAVFMPEPYRPEVPDWVIYLILIEVLLVSAVCIYYYKKGYFDHENPMWNGGRLRRR